LSHFKKEDLLEYRCAVFIHTFLHSEGLMGTFEARIFVSYGDATETFDSIAETDECTPSAISIPSVGTRVHSWTYLRVKRAIDIFGAVLMILITLAPALLIAAAIVLTSKGPVFYRESRVGRGGRPFRIWKFRSMCEDTSLQSSVKVDRSGGTLLHWRIHKHNHDPRITPVGGFLRRWSLDELPQLINVLWGDMSLIGPRPVIEEEVPLYAHLQHFYLAAAPGMSGLWQVSGRSNVSFARRADLDAFYVLNWSLRADFIILVKTIPAVLGRVGAR
jgi:exopolysaccharide production protein ExoY